MKFGPGKKRPRYAGKVVRLTWFDASFCGAQLPLDDVEEGFLVDTFGLCVRETKKGMTIAMDMPRGIDEVRHTSFVPWAMVRKVKVFGVDATVRR